jgi:RNA polymerase sigma-70 factor (ECF subfamily)
MARTPESDAQPKPRDPQSDGELMRAYREGDVRAFETLYARHSPRVWAFVRRRIWDAARAEDAFQAVFMKLHRAKETYDPDREFLPWLFTLCRSVVVDELRGRQRSSPEVEWNDRAEQVPAETLPEPGEAPALRGLGTLSSDQREALELRYRDEMPVEQIARRLETSPANVRQLLSRAIRRLKTFNRGKEIP